MTSHVPPHNRHTLFKQIVVDLSHGPSDAYAYLSDFASGRVLTFRLKLPLILKEIMCMTAKKDITVIIVKPLQPEIWQVLGNPD